MPARWRVTVPPALEQRASYIKYAILIAAVGYYLATRQITFYRYIEPFWMFTREGTTVLWLMLAVLLVASVFVRNLYCRFLCPLGAALGLLSTLTVFKIKRWNECKPVQALREDLRMGSDPQAARSSSPSACAVTTASGSTTTSSAARTGCSRRNARRARSSRESHRRADGRLRSRSTDARDEAPGPFGAGAR